MEDPRCTVQLVCLNETLGIVAAVDRARWSPCNMALHGLVSTTQQRQPESGAQRTHRRKHGLEGAAHRRDVAEAPRWRKEGGGRSSVVAEEWGGAV